MRLPNEKISHPPLTIIIVNYNTSALLRACLDSIKTQIAENDEVIVVDNHSNDGSAIIIKEKYSWVYLIANKSNVGFARANNQALSIAKGEFIWYLNPDTRLHDSAIDAALSYMGQNDKIGLAGTALCNQDGSHQQSVEFRYPGQRYINNIFDYLPGKIAWVMGASMVARRETLRAVGGFDENYFLYGEDLDLCLEIRKAGWTIGFIEDCMVLHIGGQSERHSLPESVLRKKFQAELAFYSKHYPPDAIRRIKQNNRIKAFWRMSMLIPQRLLAPTNLSLSAKLLKYRLAWEMYR